MGSPPPLGSKKFLLKFRSNSSIVIAPASTGRESNNNDAVIKIDQTKRLRRSKVTPGARKLMIVVKKLIAPRILETPAM